MDLSIVIVNWNSKEYLQKCIASIRAWTSGLTYELVVVDSASFDGCKEMLRQRFPEVRFIQSEKNLGFARANNAGYAASRGRNLLFLNPDTELAAPAVDVMYDHLQKLPNAGAVGCTLLNADKTVQTSCLQAFPTVLNQFLDSELMRALWPKSSLWGNAALFGDQKGPQKVEAISGACIMVKRAVFERVGRFSRDYFMYAEDVDLCHKIRQAGYANYYVPDATVIHFGGGCTAKGPSDFSAVMMRESVWKFMIKTRGTRYGLAYRGATLISAAGRLTVLMMLFPLDRIRRGGAPWKASFRKWRAILTWSLGFRREAGNRLNKPISDV